MVRTNPDGSCKPVDDGFEGYLEIPHANWKIEIPVLLSPGCLFCLHEIARRMIAAGHAQDCLNALQIANNLPAGNDQPSYACSQITRLYSPGLTLI